MANMPVINMVIKRLYKMTETKECLECGEQFDESKRTSIWWKKQFETMGVCAQMCDKCWKTEYKIDVKNK